MERGTVSEQLDGHFPRYVWYKDGETLYEGRLVNADLGHYKGYPLNPDEWPHGIATLL